MLVSHSQLPELVLWHLSTVPPAQLLEAEEQLKPDEHVCWVGVQEQDWHEPLEQSLEQVPSVDDPKAG